MINSLDKIIQNGVDRGLLHKHTSDECFFSSEVRIDDKQYVNFGSCSYLGLEHHEALKEAVKKTVDLYGTQFSTSRTYLSIGLYNDLETELTNMFSKPVLVSASTTLAHLAALPVIVESGDVVILDFQVHASVQMAAQLLKANQIPIYLIPHNDMEALENKIVALSTKANKIWYMADGVYSMYGDFAPLQKIETLMKRHKKLHLYIDDAHGMGWTGEMGTGYVRSQIHHHDKMVLATSLNKSYAASGGVLVFPNKEMQRKVKNCGTTMIFSGPIQPPMLGAGIASARLHQSEFFCDLQNEFKAKIAYTNKRLIELGLPQYEPSDSPLFFIPVGLPKVILDIIQRMKDKGFYLNSGGFPATPMKKGGIRFMVNNQQNIEQIESMLVTLKHEYNAVLFALGSSAYDVARKFKIESFLKTQQTTPKNKMHYNNLLEQHFSSISEIASDEWNPLFSKSGSNEHRNLQQLEEVFKGNGSKENNWDINYHMIRDEKGNIVLASVYSLALMMDDLLAEKGVSQKIKEIRKEDPFYLTSKNIITGTPFSKGKSLHIDYSNQFWKEALKIHVDYLQERAEKEGVSNIVLREFCSDQKKRLEPLLMDMGLLEMELPSNCVVEDMSWSTTEDLLSRLSQKYRYSLRKEILKKEDRFEVSYTRPISQMERRKTFDLYRSVYKRSAEISVFELPYKLFENIYKDPSYDFIYLYLKEKRDQPIAVMISQVIDKIYHAQLVGLDYQHVREHGAYKQILYQTVKRARLLNCEKMDLAYTAEMEKKKVGAVPKKNHAFAMALEHDSYAEMQTIK